MQQLVTQLKKRLADFIEQRDDLMLLSISAVNDAPMVLQTLRDLEQSGSPDLFLLFAHDFLSPGPFVTEALKHLKEQHRLVGEMLAQEGREPLPPFPDDLLSESLSASDRLRGAIDYARSLLPREGGHRLVWAMIPLKIADRRSYLRLVSSLVPWQGLQPWMRSVRLIFRADVNFRQAAPDLMNAPRVRVQRVDFSAGAIARELEREVVNEEQPLEERMPSLLSLAYMDYAHNRVEQAVTKFNLLLGYAQQTGNLQLQTIAINGLGDVAHRAGDLGQAQHWYECALVPAAEAEQPHLLATVVRNLADVAFKLEQYPEAEQYYDGLDKLHAHLLDPEGKAQALELRGVCQEKRGAYEQAIASWQSAATLCRNIGLPELLRSNLERLAELHQRLGREEQFREVEAELHEAAMPEVV